LNRVDDIVLFNPLGQEQLRQIVRLQLAQVATMLEERKITFELTPAAHELLFREGYDAAYGARPLKRAIQRLIQDPLAMRILEGEVVPGEHVVVDTDSRSAEMRFTRSGACEEVAAN
jgi:ATP-dependent Clp protease ATP-binding subunit ClpB